MIVLKILTCIVQRSCHFPSLEMSVGQYRGGSMQTQNAVDASKYLEELLNASRSQDEPVVAAMKNYFSDVRLESTIVHFDDKDGFKIPLSLQYLLPAKLEVLQIEGRIISATEGQSREIWLSSEKTLKVERGSLTTFLVSNVRAPKQSLSTNH